MDPVSPLPGIADGVGFLECRRERVGKAPVGARGEFLMRRLEVAVVGRPSEVPRHGERSFVERLIDDDGCLGVSRDSVVRLIDGAIWEP